MSHCFVLVPCTPVLGLRKEMLSLLGCASKVLGSCSKFRLRGPPCSLGVGRGGRALPCEVFLIKEGNHRITEWTGLAGTLKIISSHILTLGRGIFH